MDAVYNRNGDIEAGTIAAFEAGPWIFHPSMYKHGKSCRCVITMALFAFSTRVILRFMMT